MAAAELLPNPDRDVTQFRALNQEQIDVLATFAQISEGFTIALVELNFGQAADWLLAALETHPACAAVQWVRLDYGPELTSLYQDLMQRLPTLNLDPDKKTVLVLQSLERAIGVTGDNNPFLADLNYTRDLFAKRLPHPMVFLLPDYALTRLANQARDFWSWASGFYPLRSTPQTLDSVRQQTLDPTRLYTSDPLPAKQERIDLLQRLLMEYAPSGKEPDPTTVSARLTILQELGYSYASLADYNNAQIYFQQLLNLAQTEENFSFQAAALFGLGRSLPWWNHALKAQKYYEEALAIYRQLRDQSGEAKCLRSIGRVLQFFKQSQTALNRYEQALGIYQEIGDRLGEANCLRSIGKVLQFLKQSQEALSRYKEALVIYQQIGDRRGEANCLYLIGTALECLDQNQKALIHHKQALGICREIGDRWGEAHCLLGLGSLRVDLEQAMVCLEQAQQIFEQAGDRYNQGDTLLYIARVQKQMGDRAGARRSLAAAATISEEIGVAQFRQEAERIEAELAAEAEEAREAK